MEALSFLIPLVVFGGVTTLTLAVYRHFTPDQTALQQRLAGYNRSVPAVPTTGVTVLKEHRASGIPILQSLLGGRSLATRIAADLRAAGLPLRPGEYLLIRWILTLALALGAWLLSQSIIPALGGAVAGFFLPRLYVGRKQSARIDRFNDQLVDGLNMMSNALRSGASFPQSLDLVAHELPSPIAEEFGQVVAEVSIGSPMDEALENLINRVKSYDLFLVVTAMLVQRQTGGNLAEILENIGETIRERIKLLRQVEVLTAQERFSGIIVGLMPVFLLGALAILSPAYHGPFLETQLGRILFGVAAVFQITGFIVMNRVSKIEV